APEQVAAAKKAGEALGLDATAVSNLIAAALGAVASDVLVAQPVGGAILTGGDTAKAVCGQLGVTGLELVKEVETGVPLSRLVGGLNGLVARLPVVTKAGAFGNDQTLVRATRVLKGEE
ncbi:MAG: nucleotide-binding domain containing protein, partial [Mycobacterium leprae]